MRLSGQVYPLHQLYQHFAVNFRYLFSIACERLVQLSISDLQHVVCSFFLSCHSLGQAWREFPTVPPHSFCPAYFPSFLFCTSPGLRAHSHTYGENIFRLMASGEKRYTTRRSPQVKILWIEAQCKERRKQSCATRTGSQVQLRCVQSSTL
ncbi:unnamed protein product [Chondrus crispus]|uniref:Uncharacterized protein n=1 Tax=Chondrus crispus TaxID=2769 RepID=R7Q9B0_CHOCR|nr:unnamed protein product [Chondrus crispus]CDF34050.1 unnamed protein product [Chondrus crispus]|eukprot:XP_005713869.1 unnamed protein product [Chondrus crispus]